MRNDQAEEIETNDYALSGKIMLVAIIVLFLVIIIMLCLHVYVRLRLVRARRRQNLRRGNRPQFVFYMDPAVRIALGTRGLHPSVISTLPVFTFSDATRHAMECAVCLSEFENGETGRVLPKCNHSFHTECIDMWFQSHATCPLCRAAVEALTEETVTVCEAEAVGEEGNRSEPVGDDSSPGRNEGESTGSSFRRILSFKRIMSREKKECSSMTELDAERGECDSVSS